MSSLKVLQRIELLKDLTDSELEQLESVMHKRGVKKGEHILVAQDSGQDLMFVVEGRVKVSLVGGDGREAIVAILEEGEFFGEIALLTGENRSADVVAVTDTTILLLQKADFERHLDKNHGLARALLREMAFRLRSASEKIGDLALFDVYRRVARALKGLAKGGSGKGAETLIIEERPTHQELASMVGTSREMVTRALRELEEEGCIAVEGKTITIHHLPV